MDSLLSWIGGKKQLREQISKLIPADIKGYIEVFGGAAWVLFFKERWAKLEVYNDLDKRLFNLFMTCKYHPKALAEELQFMHSSRELFEKVIQQEGITDIQRAARFYFLVKRSFGSKCEHYGRSSKNSCPMSIETMIERIDNVSKRFNRVYIENLDYKKVFELYDHKDNFFFLDPPYRFGVQYHAGKMNYEEFLNELKKLKARWLLTLDDCEQNNELFSDYNIKKIVRVNGINRSNIKNNYFKEIIVKNY